MQCLMTYKWVKLLRTHLPEGKGLMGYWAKLASHAAFRKGQALYCGHYNRVAPGMWSGGMVGFKRILGLGSRQSVIDVMNQLMALGFITYTIDAKTKKLEYFLCDWIENCSGEACLGVTAYAIDQYGFICLPRNITDRLTKSRYLFEEADAWLDLWCHTVSNDSKNAFSFLAPTVQYGKYGAVLTLETLGQRWGWEKTKVWRFINRYNNSFCIVDFFNTQKHKNGNLNMVGTSGSGKTFALQLLAGRMRMRGIQCFILAPIKGHEFYRACNKIGGTYVKIAPGSRHCINVMEIRHTISPVKELIDEADFVELDSMLALKIQQRMIFFSLLIK